MDPATGVSAGVDLVKELGKLGLLGGIIWWLLGERTRMLAELKEVRDKFKSETDAFHERIEGKGDSYTKQLNEQSMRMQELSLQSQANDVKTNALLEGLSRAVAATQTTLTAIQVAIASRKRGGGGGEG